MRCEVVLDSSFVGTMFTFEGVGSNFPTDVLNFVEQLQETNCMASEEIRQLSIASSRLRNAMSGVMTRNKVSSLLVWMIASVLSGSCLWF